MLVLLLGQVPDVCFTGFQLLLVLVLLSVILKYFKTFVSALQANMAAKGPPPFPGVPLMSSPMGGSLPLPPSIRYGPPPQLCGPFGPRPLPPPFGMIEQ